MGGARGGWGKEWTRQGVGLMRREWDRVGLVRSEWSKEWVW